MAARRSADPSVQEFVLGPGDVLYIPRGWAHRADTHHAVTGPALLPPPPFRSAAAASTATGEQTAQGPLAEPRGDAAKAAGLPPYAAPRPQQNGFDGQGGGRGGEGGAWWEVPGVPPGPSGSGGGGGQRPWWDVPGASLHLTVGAEVEPCLSWHAPLLHAACAAAFASPVAAACAGGAGEGAGAQPVGGRGGAAPRGAAAAALLLLLATLCWAAERALPALCALCPLASAPRLRPYLLPSFLSPAPGGAPAPPPLEDVTVAPAPASTPTQHHPPPLTSPNTAPSAATTPLGDWPAAATRASRQLMRAALRAGGLPAAPAAAATTTSRLLRQHLPAILAAAAPFFPGGDAPAVATSSPGGAVGPAGGGLEGGSEPARAEAAGPAAGGLEAGGEPDADAWLLTYWLDRLVPEEAGGEEEGGEGAAAGWVAQGAGVLVSARGDAAVAEGVGVALGGLVERLAGDGGEEEGWWWWAEAWGRAERHARRLLGAREDVSCALCDLHDALLC